MTNREIGAKLGELIRSERKITNEILSLINVAMDRRSYLELGYPTMFEWLTKGFKYSNAAAYRRIEAAKVLKAVPEVSNKLENGEVNLSTVAKVQEIVKAHEKSTGQKVSAQKKTELVANIENKSVPETEQALLAIFPDSALTVRHDRRTTVDEKTTRLAVNLSNETLGDLNRAREVLSHILPEGRDADIVAYALKYLLKRKDPLQKRSRALTRTASAAEAVRVIN